VTVLCQWCGTANPDGRELCLKCNSRLLVVSGVDADAAREALLEDEGEGEQEKEAFDEHLLERLSTSEEAYKRLQAQLAGLDERVAELERSAALLDAGVQALIELLDRRRVIRETDVIAAWERAATTELAREEVLERLRARREEIVSRARTHGPAAERTSARALQSAELALLAGQPQRASDLLAAALRRTGPNPELAELLGELAFERGDLQSAERFFRQVVRWEDRNVGAHLYLGTILVDSGREAEGGIELERAVALSPEGFLPHFALGAMHARAGRAAQARTHLQRALEREKMPQAYFLLGVVELEAGRAGAAVEALEHAVALEDEFEEAIYYLGLAYLERGWHRRALESFRRVLAIDPQRLQYQEAVRLLEAGMPPLVELPPRADALVSEASQAIAAGDTGRAIRKLEGALRIVEHPSLLSALALLATATGRHRQAVGAAHRLLRQRPQGAPALAAWTALLETLRATRRYRRVEDWGGRLLGEASEPVERAIAAYEMSLAEFERGGDSDRALELAHTALELIPRELRQYPLSALGRIHLAREEYTDAVDYLEQAAALSQAPGILTQLGLALLGTGDGERAKEMLHKSRRGGADDLKTDVVTHLLRVGWLAGTGRWKG
jgi:tetratricopeptide (TPR) repeat protein